MVSRSGIFPHFDDGSDNIPLSFFSFLACLTMYAVTPNSSLVLLMLQLGDAIVRTLTRSVFGETLILSFMSCTESEHREHVVTFSGAMPTVLQTCLSICYFSLREVGDGCDPGLEVGVVMVVTTTDTGVWNWSCC